ncbi:hypothetical protein E3E36_05905 [Thermococcus sp. M36]|uniref:hypothetical protein n=1 Tax=Thermococcus sp. M36 TaxID=1638261 RepID=UPI00143C5BEB|nr:hypothetical protein [Thermococcus sp. M36]NJE05683.1 hypothetical protein [Thermococcus sp. M36]
MGKLIGGGLIILGIGLWYYGGSSGSTSMVSLGLGAIILGLVLSAFPFRGYVARDALPLLTGSLCEFVEESVRGLELEGVPVVIPPYDNLPRGGVFIPKSGRFSLSLGMLHEGDVFVLAGGGGLLISPAPGWEVVEYTVRNSGDIRGTGVGYASSAVSSTLSALGLGSAQAFDEGGGRISVFVRPLCGGSVYSDPVVVAVLLGIAMGENQLLEVESSEVVGEYVRITLRKIGGVEEWL